MMHCSVLSMCIVFLSDVNNLHGVFLSAVRTTTSQDIKCIAHTFIADLIPQVCFEWCS